MKHTVYLTRKPAGSTLPIIPPFSKEVVFDLDLQVFNVEAAFPNKFLCWSDIFINSLGAAIKAGKTSHEDWEFNVEGTIYMMDADGVFNDFQYGFFYPTL